MACIHCGHPAAVVHAFSAADGDRLAIDDLTRQAASARPELARLLRIIRERLRVQAQVADVLQVGRPSRPAQGLGFIPGLPRVYQDLIDSLAEDLADVPGRSVSARVRRRALNAAVMGELVAAAVEPLREHVRERQADLVRLANEQLAAGGIERQVNLEAVRVAVEGFDQSFWGERIIAPTADTIWRGLSTAVVGDDLDTVVARIAERTGASVPSAITEARTSLAEFDRLVTAQVAAEAGASFFIYTGPVDGITRPFCAELVGHAFTQAQVEQLDNAQTPESPIVSGGGYNCRHAWAPADAATVEVMQVPIGTDTQVKAANAAAKRGRR